jgi:broad specificity phosphatase PhoE
MTAPLGRAGALQHARPAYPIGWRLEYQLLQHRRSDMRLLEIRRHARRERPGQHLVQRGVTMAHTLGKKFGPFDLVATSPLARCVETAVAMGFAVDQDRPELAGEDGLGESVPGLPDDFDWDDGYAGFGRLLSQSEPFAAFARGQAAIWLDVARSLPEGGRALIVGHGGAIESGAVAAFPEAEHATWGRTARHCEGALIGLDGDRFVSIKILRVSKALRAYLRLRPCAV